MKSLVMKVGTMSMEAYFIKGKKALLKYAEKDKITFKPQSVAGAKWEHGIITEIRNGLLFVERW